MTCDVNTVIYFPMKTSLDLPDNLYRRVKSKSALEGRAVREVATALFSAWVEGRVTADFATPGAGTGDAQREWLARWGELAARVTEATGGASGLAEQLGQDRR